MHSILCRRQLRVSCESQKNTPASQLGDKLRSVRKSLIVQRKRLEDERANSFRSLTDALKKIVDDEIAFVKKLASTTSEMCSKSKEDEAAASADAAASKDSDLSSDEDA